MGRVLLSALPEEQLEVTLSRATPAFTYTRIPCAICPVYVQRSPGCACRAMLADRQIEVGLCSLAVPVLRVTVRVVAALNVGVPAATVSAMRR